MALVILRVVVGLVVLRVPGKFAFVQVHCTTLILHFLQARTRNIGLHSIHPPVYRCRYARVDQLYRNSTVTLLNVCCSRVGLHSSGSALTRVVEIFRQPKGMQLILCLVSTPSVSLTCDVYLTFQPLFLFPWFTCSQACPAGEYDEDFKTECCDFVNDCPTGCCPPTLYAFRPDLNLIYCAVDY